jgi:hypothetical protein
VNKLPTVEDLKVQIDSLGEEIAADINSMEQHIKSHNENIQDVS